jgi:hypothetical protein
MEDYALGRVLDMDSWAGEESIATMHEQTIEILRPDGSWNRYGNGDRTIQSFFSGYIHYEPIVQPTAREKMKMRNVKHQETKGNKLRSKNKERIKRKRVDSEMAEEKKKKE